jgi:protein-disulfide isomerase
MSATPGPAPDDGRRRRLIGLAATVAVAAIVVMVLILVSQGDDKKTSAPSTPTSSTPGRPAPGRFTGIPQSGLALGAPTAPVTLVEFADLQCPFCRQYTEAVLPTIVKRYVRTGKVRLEFRILSFLGPDSRKAGLLAAAAGTQSKLWDFIDTFYAHQGEENSGYVTDAFLHQITGQIAGLDAPRAFTDAAKPEAASVLRAADALASANGVDSTPGFIVSKQGAPPQRLNPRALTPEAFTAPLDKLLGR